MINNNNGGYDDVDDNGDIRNGDDNNYNVTNSTEDMY